MIKMTFVCHGNICRSPMAEFLMKKYVAERGEADKFYIKSAATSGEEIGNPVHGGTKRILNRLGIDCGEKRAVRLTASDYDKCDYFIGMDSYNFIGMKRLFGGDKEDKVSLLLDYTDTPRDVADPWYTGDFEKTYADITRGIEGFYSHVKSIGKV